ncbi:hypothetical protein CEXT_125131 [Caerostris extrusa]|uniref:Uncharacterized protein n=1 Tax=Caerostris extrusa TaxID=172846 RepID=A0AAV4S288_CAEEX|nr:hypothetical protein CEXT_125131 [Caerostris extrusa]
MTFIVESPLLNNPQYLLSELICPLPPLSSHKESAQFVNLSYSLKLLVETYDCPSATITWSITSPILKLSNDNGRRSPGCYIKCLFKGKSPGNRDIEVKPPRSFIYFMSLLTIRGTPLTSSSSHPLFAYGKWTSSLKTHR